MYWYLKVLKNYATFEGRARRKEYWMFFLFNSIIAFLIGFIEGFLGSSGAIGIIYSFAVLIPGIAVFVRRMHDVNKSGWMWFLVLLPIIGWIWLFVLLVNDGTSGENKYGLNTKES